MNKKTVKLTKDRLHNMIAEELEALDEAVDHGGVASVVNAADKLLAAVVKFKESATGKMKGSVMPGLEQLEKSLEHMLEAPKTYVDSVSTQKVVKLRAVKDDKVM